MPDKVLNTGNRAPQSQLSAFAGHKYRPVEPVSEQIEAFLEKFVNFS